jgi:di/tricarboxylate transporter
MLSLDLILVFVIIAFILVSLYWGILGPSFTFVIAISILGFAGILTPGEILAGFANEQIAVVIMLLLLGDIIRQTAVIEVIFDRIFRNAKSYRGFQSRMLIIISVFSSFLNNTPLVAVMMPYVNSWCKRNKIAPSKFLMPLSYAAILGGCATLIGTSTNLIVNGLVEDQTIIPGLKPLKIFDFTAVGLPMMIIGFFYILFFGYRLLPENEHMEEELAGSSREYLVEAKVKPGSHLAGMNLKKAGFTGDNSHTLVEIIRDEIKILSFTDDFVLAVGDILVLTGDTSSITDLWMRNQDCNYPKLE